MDSEDDMHDANDVDSLDDFYSGDTGMASDDGDEDGDYGFNDSSDSDDTTSHRQQQNYTILNEEDIRQRQEEDITNISTVLSISEISASILLRHYNWSVGKVHDAWFADEEKVRKAVGLLEKPVIQIPNIAELTCGICFEAYLRDRMKAAACGHLFCSSCWTGYISNSINDGPGCLMLRCPDPSCGAAVGQDMISLLASNEDKQKYSRYLLRSYVEDNKKTKWCPAPGCEYAVDFVVGSSCYDVSCNCTHSFCWNCTEEAHRPVDCSTVAKWILKNSAESENMNWILANSKPCPKCKRPIEKNQGCMHITCTPPCKFEFCCKKRAGGCSENIKQEMVGKKDKCSKRNGKGSMKKFTDMKGKQNLLSIFAEARNLCQKKDGECKRSYSRNELEALRFVNGDDQRQIWKEIYTGLGPIVAKELNNMADSRKQNHNGANGKNCKNTVLLQHAEKQKADAPILLGYVAAKGKGTYLQTIEVKNIWKNCRIPYVHYASINH